MSSKTHVLACEVLKHEFEKVIGDRDIALTLIEQGLHNTPKIMPEKLIEKIAEIEAAEKPERLLLGYGLCSNGIVGVSGTACEVVVPRCHDCIALLMGSVARYNEVFAKNPGTYYLTTGWVECGDDPLSCVEQKYIPRLGQEKALRAMGLELANYTHICYIDNGLGDQAGLKARVKENCAVFKKEYAEMKADLTFFHQLLDGPYKEGDFLSLKPGEEIEADMFYDW